MKYIDTHCHYESAKFQKHLDSIMKKVSGCCEKVICVGTNIRENAEIVKLYNKYDFMYGMAGFFPTFVNFLDESLCESAAENLEVLKKQLSHPKNVGLGEIGLDYNWNSVGNISGKKAQELQKKWFINQITLAKEMNKPISIHSRDAEEDTISILSNWDSIDGVVHCFSYGPKAAKFFIEKGMYLGIGGTSTYKNNEKIRDAIIKTPIERILLETDAPYLSPEPVRKSINDSTNIRYIISLISSLKGITEEEVIYKTNENCYRLYDFH